MTDSKRPMELEDDARERVSLMIEHRLPWLLIGLIGGILLTIVISNFEGLLESNIQLTFFMPVIVYMAAALGSQTGNVYIRNIGREKVKLSGYIVKEVLFGIALGVGFGVGIGIFAYLWFQSLQTAITVGLAMTVTMAIAPLIGLMIPALLQREHTDPAVGAGPSATVIQDALSLLVYFAIAGVVLSS